MIENSRHVDFLLNSESFLGGFAGFGDGVIIAFFHGVWTCESRRELVKILQRWVKAFFGRCLRAKLGISSVSGTFRFLRNYVLFLIKDEVMSICSSAKVSKLRRCCSIKVDRESLHFWICDGIRDEVGFECLWEEFSQKAGIGSYGIVGD